MWCRVPHSTNRGTGSGTVRDSMTSFFLYIEEGPWRSPRASRWCPRSPLHPMTSRFRRSLREKNHRRKRTIRVKIQDKNGLKKIKRGPAHHERIGRTRSPTRRWRMYQADPFRHAAADRASCSSPWRAKNTMKDVMIRDIPFYSVCDILPVFAEGTISPISRAPEDRRHQRTCPGARGLRQTAAGTGAADDTVRPILS